GRRFSLRGRSEFVERVGIGERGDGRAGSISKIPRPQARSGDSRNTRESQGGHQPSSRVSPIVLIAPATAATTTAVAAATTAAATAVATATTTTATAAAAIRFGTRLVDGQGPAIDFRTIQRGDCRLRFRVIAHLHEAEAL